MLKNYRHGDLALIGIEKIPESGISKTDLKIIMKGSGGNAHSFDNGVMYFLDKEDPFIIGYLMAKNTTLFHKEHGKVVEDQKLREAKIEDGLYELRKQVEYTHKGIRPVID